MSIDTGSINPQEVAEGVDALEWSEERFDHCGHLAAGAWWWHVHGTSALEHARRAIRRFNEANGGENTDTAGYHETLTIYYLAALAELVADETPDRAWFEGHFDDASVQQTAPLRYWSKAVLMGTEARKGWVAPDKRTLPDAVHAQVERLRNG